jgi:hypothetical protein
MKAHQAKTLMLLLTAFLTLNLPSVAQSVEDNLPVLRELAGIDARVYNQQDSTRAGISFENGLLAFENILLKEGLRRVKNDKENEGSSSQDALIQVANTLQVCKQSCENPEVRCLKRADGSNILAATLCRISFAECQLQCTQNLLDAVNSITDFPIKGVGTEQQRDEAQRANLEQESEDAKLAARRGPSNMQKVALEEGTRDTLDAYEEYGVPEEQTRIITASRSLIVCSQQAVFQTSDCVKGALDSSGGDAAPATAFLLSSIQCEITGIASQLSCARATVNRFNPSSD